MTENGDWVALLWAAGDAGRKDEITTLLGGNEPQQRTATSVLTRVTDDKGLHVLETTRDHEPARDHRAPTKIEIVVAYNNKEGGFGCIVLPARFAFWNDDKDMYDLDRIQPIILRGKLKPEELIRILTEAYFHPSVDDPAEDPDQAELAGFCVAARKRAGRVLRAKFESEKKVELNLHSHPTENGWLTTATATAVVDDAALEAEAWREGPKQVETESGAAAEAVHRLLSLSAQV